MLGQLRHSYGTSMSPSNVYCHAPITDNNKFLYRATRYLLFPEHGLETFNGQLVMSSHNSLNRSCNPLSSESIIRRCSGNNCTNSFLLLRMSLNDSKTEWPECHVAQCLLHKPDWTKISKLARSVSFYWKYTQCPTNETKQLYQPIIGNYITSQPPFYTTYTTRNYSFFF